MDEVEAAVERGAHDEVLRLTDAILTERPGDDAAHELRARSLAALGRLDEAERHASEAVRLDPDEVRYHELLAEVLAARGAHRDAATEYGRLARNDPAQAAWTIAEAQERLDAADSGEAAAAGSATRSVEVARQAVRLDPANADAQLVLARVLVRNGDASGALQAATAAADLRPGDPAVREVVADARWLANQPQAAFAEFAALCGDLVGPDRARVTAKARSLYRQRTGPLGRLLAGLPPLFGFALRNAWLHLG